MGELIGIGLWVLIVVGIGIWITGEKPVKRNTEEYLKAIGSGLCPCCGGTLVVVGYRHDHHGERVDEIFCGNGKCTRFGARLSSTEKQYVIDETRRRRESMARPKGER